ncbi:MAG: DUF3316 domain-containing protein [Bacteroidaceae bacterium]|nr:DUF3316 domain-containing protein [Bacteroidaceae bacterium]MBQ9295023.1 DUF3316 domain-containing protein [Bacteroidaceae bacterium]
MKQLHIFIIYMSALLPASLWAEDVTLEPVQNRRPTERSLLVGAGKTNQLDTYLSPMEYTGVQVSVLVQRERMTHLADHHISFQSTFHGAFTSTDNPAGTAKYLGGRLAYDAGWHYHYSPLQNLDLKGGALVGADAGFLYNDRNGNNPAQGRFSLDLSLSAGASYAFRIKKLPLRAAYQADLPMMGIMFCPEFGESYYEISQRGVGHDIIFAHPGNAMNLRQLLTLDFCLRRVTLRVGYLCDIRQQNARSLKNHDVSHSFMFGFVRYFQLMKRKPHPQSLSIERGE